MARISAHGKAIALCIVLLVPSAYAKTLVHEEKKLSTPRDTAKAPEVKPAKKSSSTKSASSHKRSHHGPKAVTLLDAFERTLNTNPAILQSVANQQAAKQNLSGTRAGYYPTVSANYYMGHNRSTVPSSGYIDSFLQSRSITASQLLFDGGVLSSAVGVANAQFEESQSLTQEEVNTLAMDATTAYISYLRDTKLLALSKKNLSSHRHTLKRIKKRFEGGINGISEYELAKSRLAQAETVYFADKANLEVVESNYLRIVGAPPRGLVEPRFNRSALPKTLGEALEIADKNNPSIQVARKQLKAAIKSLKEAKASAYSPEVSLELSASRDNNVGGLQGVSVDMQGTVNVSYTLFKGGADMDAIRKAASLKVASEQNLADVKLSVENQLRQTWADMISAHNSVAPFHKRVLSGEKVLDSYRKQFLIGKRSLLNVLDVENQLFSSQTAMLDNDYRLKSDYYQILSDMGTLPKYFAQELSKKYTRS